MADGRMKIRDNEQENSSSAVEIESLFMFAAVFAAEQRRVITIDIDGEFLHEVMTNDVYVEITGQNVDVLLYSYRDMYDKLV